MVSVPFKESFNNERKAFKANSSSPDKPMMADEEILAKLRIFCHGWGTYPFSPSDPEWSRAQELYLNM